MEEGYGWNAAGNQHPDQGGSYVEALVYDPLNRLIGARLLPEDGISVSKLTQGLDTTGKKYQRSGSGRLRQHQHR